MGTKYFDVDDLKKWHKDNETSTAKSSKIFEHITRLFKGNREISPSVKSATAEPLNLENSPAGNVTGEKVTEDSNAPEMVLYELCSVILSKLVEAHTAYEKRFGSFKNEHISANMLLKDANKGIEALAECFGKQFFKRHLIKAGCSRLHHEISYRVVLSSIDESFHASSSGGKSSKKTASAKETESGEGPGSLDGVLEDGKTDNSSGSSPPQDSAIEKDEEGGGMPTLMEISLNLKETPNFSTSDCVPDTHRYRLTAFQPQNQRVFLKTVQKELVLLQESLPEGIVVKGFEDRMVVVAIKALDTVDLIYICIFFKFLCRTCTLSWLRAQKKRLMKMEFSCLIFTCLQPTPLSLRWSITSHFVQVDSIQTYTRRAKSACHC